MLWAIPFILTIICYTIAIFLFSHREQSTGVIDWTLLQFIFTFGLATFIVLIVWLVYFIIF